MLSRVGATEQRHRPCSVVVRKKPTKHPSAFGASRTDHRVDRRPRPCRQRHGRERLRRPHSRTQYIQQPSRGRLTESRARLGHSDGCAGAIEASPCLRLVWRRSVLEKQNKSAQHVRAAVGAPRERLSTRVHDALAWSSSGWSELSRSPYRSRFHPTWHQSPLPYGRRSRS